MPYVDQEVRDRIENGDLPRTPGDLNYAMTRLAVEYIKEKGLNYTFINDVMGAFDSASKEFYRRVAVPYEQAKQEANGDVYQGVLL